MRPILRLMAAAFVLAGLTAERASADMLYEATVSGEFRKGNDPAGTFSGTFDFSTNGTTLTLTGANISTTAATVGSGPNPDVFIAQTYTLANTDPTKNTFDASKLHLEISNDYWLTLVFDPQLFTAAPGIKPNSSQEHQNIAGSTGSGNRDVVSGTITIVSVPEPSAVAVVAICAPALLAYARRRRKVASAA